MIIINNKQLFVFIIINNKHLFMFTNKQLLRSEEMFITQDVYILDV